MRIVYVAGRYSGPHAWAIAQHVREAEAVALEVWRAGAVALCPHANAAHFAGTLPEDVFMVGDLALLDRCDAVVTVPGWEHSAGATAEVAHAITRAIPVFHELATLRAWLDEYHVPDATGEP